MNAFQPCPNNTDLVPLYLAQQLYLKPIARISMSLQLPNIKKLGKSVSHLEIMDKIRELIRPDEFTVFKVTKTTIEFVRFEAEIETKSKLDRVVSKINNKMIKLKDFSELMRVKASEWKSDFPSRRVWDDFFQNARDMDEMKPGERPDTVHISNLPSKWFIPHHLSDEEDVTPSEKILYRIFEKFGSIRYVDIPICDPYRKKMKDHISGLKNSSFDSKAFFEGYVQYKDYIGFTKAMDALRNMKLVKKEEDCATEVNIKVDFDKTKHLSDASIRRREIVRDRLVKKAREKEEREEAEEEEKKQNEELERQKQVDVKAEREQRRKVREERRKAKILEKLEITGTDEINEKIVREEKKLLKVQRKLESIRLVEELFKRIEEKRNENIQLYTNDLNPAYDELKRFKNASELAVLNQREKLHNAVKGRVILKSILADGNNSRKYSSGSETSLSLEEEIIPHRPSGPVLEKYPELLYNPPWLGYHYPLPPAPMYGDFGDAYAIRGYIPRGRPFPRFPIMPGTSRGRSYNRRRGNYNPRFRRGLRGSRHNQYSPDFEDDYHEHDHRNRRSRSYSPRRRSRDTRSRSTSRRRRSYSSSRSRSRSRRRRDERSHSSSYHRSRSRSRRSPSRSRSTSSKRRRSRSREKTSRKKDKHRDKSLSKGKSRSREKSVDSSKFMTPKQLHEQMSQRKERSKSWSLPKDDKEKRSSWSKSPEQKD